MHSAAPRRPPPFYPDDLRMRIFGRLSRAPKPTKKNTPPAPGSLRVFYSPFLFDVRPFPLTYLPPRSTDLRREILKFGQAIFHWKNRFCVIQMHLRLERKITESADANIDQAERWMIDRDVAAALRAIPTIANVAALESPERLCSVSKTTFSLFHNVNALTGAAE